MRTMKSAGVIIDSSKLNVFEGALRRAGFRWKRHKGVTWDTVTLKVEYDDATFEKLHKLVAGANEVATVGKRGNVPLH